MQIAHIIKNERQLFTSKKQNYLFITKDILEKIIEKELLSIFHLNINTTFKIALEVLYENEKADLYHGRDKKNYIYGDGSHKGRNIFCRERLIYNSIHEVEQNQYGA